MAVFFMGFVFLIAAIFPVGELIWPVVRGLTFGQNLRGAPTLLLHGLFLLVTYLPAAFVTWWFLSASRLRSRLPFPIPGYALITSGVVVSVLYLVVRVFAATVEGGGGSYVVAILAPYAVWPARVLLALGIVRVLLAAAPSNHLQGLPAASTPSH